MLDCWLSRTGDLAAAEGVVPSHDQLDRVRPRACGHERAALVERDFLRVPPIGLPCAAGAQLCPGLSHCRGHTLAGSGRVGAVEQRANTTRHGLAARPLCEYRRTLSAAACRHSSHESPGARGRPSCRSDTGSPLATPSRGPGDRGREVLGSGPRPAARADHRSTRAADRSAALGIGRAPADMGHEPLGGRVA